MECLEGRLLMQHKKQLLAAFFFSVMVRLSATKYNIFQKLTGLRSDKSYKVLPSANFGFFNFAHYWVILKLSNSSMHVNVLQTGLIKGPRDCNIVIDISSLYRRSL